MAENTLQQWAKQGKLQQAKLSPDGKSLSLDDITLDASQVIDVSAPDGKSCRYTLASIFLQVLDPSQALMAYRNACKAHSVQDPIKPLDKPTVVTFFVGSSTQPRPPSPTATADKASAKEQAARASSHQRSKEKKRSRHDKHDTSRKRRRDRDSSTSSDHHHHKHKRPSSSSTTDVAQEKKRKKLKAPMTTEQLFSNLNVVVDKRSTGDEAQQEIHKALSATGFDVSPDILEQYRATLESSILPLEIPVGNSASILRPATSVERDFSRVLDLYNQTVAKPPSSSGSSKKNKPPSSSSSAGSPSKSQKQDRSFLIGKKPIIVLPKGMSAPITMANGYEFFCNSTYVPRTAVRGRVQKPPTTFTRKVATRLGGGVVEYELMDNPTTKLGKDASEWQRVVSVIALGASWQFADWPGQFSKPVHLFSRTYGFYIGMEGDKIPPELETWAVRKGKLNRDKRGLDSVCYASFWNGLDEWMAIHKPEMLPKASTVTR